MVPIYSTIVLYDKTFNPLKQYVFEYCTKLQLGLNPELIIWRGEYPSPYRDDCTEVKSLLFCVVKTG